MDASKFSTDCFSSRKSLLFNSGFVWARIVLWPKLPPDERCSGHPRDASANLGDGWLELRQQIQYSAFLSAGEYFRQTQLADLVFSDVLVSHICPPLVLFMISLSALRTLGMGGA